MLAEILNQSYFNNSLLEYLIALAIIAGGLLLAYVFKRLILARLSRMAGESSNQFFEMLIPSLNRTLVPLLYFGAFYIGINNLTLSTGVQRFLDIVAIITLTFFGIRFLINLVGYVIEKAWLQRIDEGPDAEGSVRAMLPVVKVVIWGLGLIFLLDNLGFKISTVIAGLGIGGIAVALAAQAILVDLFSYFSILFDRPFKIGDFLIIDEHLGVVEHIGIKTTRIRSLSGEQMVFSNTDLTSSRLRNFKRMERRRVAFKIGVVYDTSQENLKAMPGLIKEIIESIENTQFDRAHFVSYGAYSLDFEIVYFIFSSDYNMYMDVQQEINLKMREAFNDRGIEFAYPTQTLLLHAAGNGDQGLRFELDHASRNN